MSEQEVQNELEEGVLPEVEGQQALDASIGPKGLSVIVDDGKKHSRTGSITLHAGAPGSTRSRAHSVKLHTPRAQDVLLENRGSDTAMETDTAMTDSERLALSQSFAGTPGARDRPASNTGLRAPGGGQSRPATISTSTRAGFATNTFNIAPASRTSPTHADGTKLSEKQTLMAIPAESKREESPKFEGSGRFTFTKKLAFPACCWSGGLVCGLVPVALAVGAGSVILMVVVLSTVLTLPETVSCDPADSGKYFITSIPPPELHSVYPPMVCSYYMLRNMSVQGANYLKYNGRNPSVTLQDSTHNITLVPYNDPSHCVPVKVRKQEVELCYRFNSSVPIYNMSIYHDSSPFFFNITLTDPFPDAPHATAKASSQCIAQSNYSLLYLPPPTVASVYPPLVCLGTKHILTVSGKNFVRNVFNSSQNAKHQVADVRLNNKAHIVDGSELGTNDPSCKSWAVYGYDSVQTCGNFTLALDVDAADVAKPGVGQHNAVNDVSLVNPAPADCANLAATPVGPNFYVSKRPHVLQVDPPVFCLAQAPNTITATGLRFFVINDLPSPFGLKLDGLAVEPPLPLPAPATAFSQCVEWADTTHDVLSCSKVMITLPALPKTNTITTTTTNATEAFLLFPKLTVRSPVQETCVTEHGLFALLAPPSGHATSFTGLCRQGDEVQSVTFQGSFAHLHAPGNVTWLPEFWAELRTVNENVTNISHQVAPVDASFAGCGSAISLPGPQNWTAQKCTTVSLSFNISHLTTHGQDITYKVYARNPAPGSSNPCQSKLGGVLYLIDPPALTGSYPEATCGGAASDVQLFGTFYLDQNHAPEVFVENQSSPNVWTTLSNCTEISVGEDEVPLLNCSKLKMITPISVNSLGPLALTVTHGTCSASSSSLLQGFPQPHLYSLDPNRICVNVSYSPILVNGSNFVVIGGVRPSIYIDSSPQTVISHNDCQNDPADNSRQLCKEIGFEVDHVNSRLTGGGFVALELSNTAGCGVVDDTLLYVEPIPKIDNHTIWEYCVDEGGVVTILGQDFSPYAEVRVYSNLRFGTGYVTPAITVNSSKKITMDLPPYNPLLSALYDVEVVNLAGCSFYQPEALRVHPKVLMFYADPPILFRKLGLQITLFGTGLLDKVKTVTLFNNNFTRTYQANQTTYRIKNGEPRYNEIQLVVPAQSLPTGSYNVLLESRIGCSAIGNEALKVTEQVSINITSIFPTIGYYRERTSIVVTAAAAGQSFEEGSRVYLSAADLGTPLSSVSLIGDSDTSFQLTAVLPADIFNITAPLTLALSVVTPSGNVGVLSAAFTLYPYETPIVDTVGPNTISGNPTMDIYGRGFDPTGHTVQLQCGLSTATMACSPDCGAGGGTTKKFSFLQSATLQKNDVCKIKITKKSDGLSFTFSSVGTQNPSGKIGCLFPGSRALVTARRRPAVFTNRVSANERFLYVAGGDSSSTATVSPLSTVEVSAFDTTGQPGEFVAFDSQYNLPRGAGYAAFAQIGRFLYVIGGHNGTHTQRTIQRAQVLNPFDTASISVDVDVIVNTSDAKNFSLTPFSKGGLFYYRVSALFGPNDTYNPNGESLASEPLNVLLPDLSQYQVELELEWDKVPRAVGYRLYRTQEAGNSLSNISLLVETRVATAGDSANTYRDDGSWLGLPVQKPLKVGQIGRWATTQVGTQLVQARWGATATATPHPTLPNVYFLYVFYGFVNPSPANGQTNFATGIEVSVVTIYPQDSLTLNHERQDLTPFTVLTGGPVRALHRTVIVDGLIWSAMGRNIILMNLGGYASAEGTKTLEWFHILNSTDGSLGNRQFSGATQAFYPDIAGSHAYVRSGSEGEKPTVYMVSGWDTKNFPDVFPTWGDTSLKGASSATIDTASPLPDYRSASATTSQGYFPASSVGSAGNSGCPNPPGDLSNDRVYTSYAIEYSRQYVIGGVFLNGTVSRTVVWAGF